MVRRVGIGLRPGQVGAARRGSAAGEDDVVRGDTIRVGIANAYRPCDRGSAVIEAGGP